MILKTLAFILLFYLLIKFISRLFMPSGSKRKNTARIIFQTLKNIQQQQKQEKQRPRAANRQEYFEEVEEAEFEDITEEKNQPS